MKLNPYSRSIREGCHSGCAIKKCKDHFILFSFILILSLKQVCTLKHRYSALLFSHGLMMPSHICLVLILIIFSKMYNIFWFFFNSITALQCRNAGSYSLLLLLYDKISKSIFMSVIINWVSWIWPTVSKASK